MYLAQSVEECRRPYAGIQDTGFTLLVYKVTLNAAGRPVWALHRDAGRYWAFSTLFHLVEAARRGARRLRAPNVPLMRHAGPGKLVTPRQAQRLTGVEHPMGALDMLREQVSEHPDYPGLQNYVEPAKPKPEKAEPEPAAPPTPLSRATAKLARAEAKVQEWTDAIRRAQTKCREWQKKVRYHRRRADRLGRTPAPSAFSAIGPLPNE